MSKNISKKNIKKIIIVNIFIFCFGLVLIEIFLRFFFPLNLIGYTSAYEYDAELGIIAKKNLMYTNLKDYREEFHTNQIGTVNYSEDFSKYKKIIFTIGDSYTQGTGLPIDSSYPAQLDLILNVSNGRYNFEYAVVNLGLGGYGSIQEKIALERYIKILKKPDYVFVLGCVNDAWDNYRYESGLIFKNPLEGNPNYGSFSKLISWFAFQTEIGKNFFTALKNLKKNGVKSFRHDNNVVDSLYKNYHEIIELSKKYNFKVIFSFASYPRIDDYNYKSLKKWASINQVGFADWIPAVLSVKNSIPQIPIENDHSAGHFRSWVNHLIAESFAIEMKNFSEKKSLD